MCAGCAARPVENAGRAEALPAWLYLPEEKILLLKNISAASRADILKRIVDCGIDVEHFETYKPSLNDIFVSLVGDEADNDNKKNNIEGGAH